MKKLPVINNNVIKNTTCFHEHKQYGVNCKKMDCKFWIKNCKSNNCVLIAAETPMTLHEIGQIFDLTRMRICQIEKNAKTKLFEIIKINNNFLQYRKNS
jgi:hypothetical protein